MNQKYTQEMLREIEISELSDFSHELEKVWRRSRLKFTDKELVSLFPEAKQIISQKIEEWKEVLKLKRETVRCSLKEIYKLNVDDLSKWFGEYMVEVFLFNEVKGIYKHIGRLQRQLMQINGEQGVRIEFWDNQLEKARGKPIADIAEQNLLVRNIGNRFSAKCPFHEDKTPSFYIYPETNTYHCFGCQAHGDVINLTMHLYGLSFKEAVQMLNQ